MGGDGKGNNFCAWVVCVAQKPCRLQGKIRFYAIFRLCILSLSTVQSVRKGKSCGVFKEHELYSNSYEQRARPHQLHPLLGCHRHSWKEKSLVKKVTPSSPFNWIPFFQPLSLPHSPTPFTFVEPEGRCLTVAWSQEWSENSVAEENCSRAFFFPFGRSPSRKSKKKLVRATKKKKKIKMFTRRSEPSEWALTLIFSSLMFFDSRDGFCRKVGTARNIVLYRRLR